MAKRMTGQQLLNQMNRSGNASLKDILVDLKVDKNTRVVEKTIRLIGDAIEYREAQPRKRDENDPKKTIPCEFPDKEETPDYKQNKSFTRICDDDPKKDVWTKQGYISTKRYAINVIERASADGESDTVKILAKGKSIFQEFFNLEQFNRSLMEKMKKNNSNAPALWTEAGGEFAPDFVITATYDENALGKVKYQVNPMPYAQQITEEEIELLRAAGQPTAEKLAKIREENPELANRPDWMFYGYDLEFRFSPTPLRKKDQAEETTQEEMAINAFDGEEETEAEVTPKSRSRKNTPKSETVEDTDKTEEADLDENTMDDVDW